MENKAKEIKGHCPFCNAERNAHIEVCYKTEASDDYIWSSTEYRILKCKGCDTIYFQEYSLCSEDIVNYYHPVTGEPESEISPQINHWPTVSKRAKPNWYREIQAVDINLFNLLEEVYIALDNDLHVLAAMGVRTVFDRTSELMEINPSLSFAKKLNAMVEKKFIAEKERNSLDILTDAGSAAAHRGWKPTVKELETLISVIEQFIYRQFVLDTEIKTLKLRVPKRM